MIDLEITTEFAAGFRPTNVQIVYACEYMEESRTWLADRCGGFPWQDAWDLEKMVRGARLLWMAGAPAVWVRSRVVTLAALEAGNAGNALFRVYSDGHIHLVDEA